MANISINVVFMFLVSVASQVFAIYLLPLTRGATAPLPTLSVMGLFCIFAVILSKLLNYGMNLSLVIPLISAAIPLGAILVAIFVYGEPASFAKVASLLVACGLIGLANLL